ncbi:hypothetical protein TNCV_2502151 [Trichonephila clavipes]|nr:hypothetical protein TNCV_2502151 [Trichonephila clavipes]
MVSGMSRLSTTVDYAFNDPLLKIPSDYHIAPTKMKAPPIRMFDQPASLRPTDTSRSESSANCSYSSPVTSSRHLSVPIPSIQVDRFV